jgi:hypothetical protein
LRRILLVLTVAALMAAMVVGAGPAKADSSGNTSGFNNSPGVIQGNDGLFGFGDNADDCNGLDFADNTTNDLFGDNTTNDLFGNDGLFGNNDCNGNGLFGDNTNDLFGDNNGGLRIG